MYNIRKNTIHYKTLNLLEISQSLYLKIWIKPYLVFWHRNPDMLLISAFRTCGHTCGVWQLQKVFISLLQPAHSQHTQAMRGRPRCRCFDPGVRCVGWSILMQVQNVFQIQKTSHSAYYLRPKVFFPKLQKCDPTSFFPFHTQKQVTLTSCENSCESLVKESWCSERKFFYWS